MALLIRHADVITMTERGRFTGDVLIRGGVIDRLGECCPPDEDEVYEIDATGLTLMPGYVWSWTLMASSRRTYVLSRRIA